MSSERRVLEKGEPITELVKGSLEYTLYQIRQAFRKQFPWREGQPWFYVEDTFQSYIIVNSGDLPDDEYFYVTYERDGDDFTFADRDDWEIVELGYSPGSSDAGDVAESARSRPKRFVEQLFGTTSLAEARQNKPRVIHADLAQADVVNANGRRYRREVLKEAVIEAQTHLHESLSQGRAILLGEAEHPIDKRQTARLLETIVKWVDVTFDDSDDWVKVKGEMIENSVGRDAIITMDAGVLPGISLRGYGESEIIEEDGREVEEVIWLRLTGADLVLNPGFEKAAVTLLESKEEQKMAAKTKKGEGEEGTTAPDPTPAPEKKETAPEPTFSASDVNEAREQAVEEFKKKQKAEAEKAAAKAQQEREKALREQLGLGDDDDIDEALATRNKRLAELEAAESRRAIENHIDEATRDLNYPDNLRTSFLAWVGEPESIPDADKKIAEARKVYDPLAADRRLASMGFRGVQVLGPVIESEANVPEFARASFEITESLRKQNVFKPASKRQKDTRAEIFTQAYLEAFDQRYQQHLLREARSWNEAMLTTQLNLPYSVIRAIIDEAFPQLLAPDIFDVGVVANNPTRIFYEANFVEETGVTASITNEGATSDEGAWIALANPRLVRGTVVVTGTGGTPTYVEGTDYEINYVDGELFTIAAAQGGSIGDATTLEVDYDYKAIRKGENQPIERARSTVKFLDMSLTADRLATDISDEVIKFSQSQLGYDAVGRTLNLLVKNVRRNVDANLLDTALAYVAVVLNNSGGTWNSASDPVSELIEKIGVAKTIIANRPYMPTAIVMSLTNSDRLSNSDNFTAAGDRPDSDLNANGYVGRVKGLPVFSSTEFVDSRILVLNRELVMYRTWGDMELRGPFPKYDATTGEIIANDQYYVQEYNDFAVPIAQKGAIVKVS